MDNFHSFQDIPIIKQLFELYGLYYGYWQLFPKKDKYALGQKCENYITAILELILTAQNLPADSRKNILLQASIKLDALKIFFRLLKTINILDAKKYLRLQTMLQEIGKMLGGWLKSLN